MTPSEAIKSVIKGTGLSVNATSRLLGFNSPSALQMVLRRKMAADTLIDIMDKLGYEVIIQQKTSGKHKEGAIVLEKSDIEDKRSAEHVHARIAAKKAENSAE